MHHEAALYMAQALGLAIDDARWQAAPLPEPPAALSFEPGTWWLGSGSDAGFAFDNELAAHESMLGPTTIDAQAVRWAEFLPFIESAGAQPRRAICGARRAHGSNGATAAGSRWTCAQPPAT